MADWNDVIAARKDADVMATEVPEAPLTTNDPGLMCAMLALRLELRAHGMLLDYLASDARRHG